MRSAVCRELCTRVSDPGAIAETKQRWGEMQAHEQELHTNLAKVRKSVVKRGEGRSKQRDADTAAPSASTALLHVPCTRPISLAPVLVSNEEDTRNADRMDGLGGAALAVRPQTEAATIVPLSVQRACNTLDTCYGGSSAKAADGFQDLVCKCCGDADDFPTGWQYPRQCGAACSKLATAQASWSHWSLYSEFLKFINSEVSRLGGQLACYSLRLAFAFESYQGDGILRDTTYALIAGLRFQPSKACMFLEMSGPPTTLTCDVHIGTQLTFARRPYVESKREDIPECFIDLLKYTGEIGPLADYDADEFAVKLVGSGDSLATEIRIILLAFR